MDWISMVQSGSDWFHWQLSPKCFKAESKHFKNSTLESGVCMMLFGFKDLYSLCQNALRLLCRNKLKNSNHSTTILAVLHLCSCVVSVLATAWCKTYTNRRTTKQRRCNIPSVISPMFKGQLLQCSDFGHEFWTWTLSPSLNLAALLLGTKMSSQCQLMSCNRVS